jgi:hypothetical protein
MGKNNFVLLLMLSGVLLIHPINVLSCWGFCKKSQADEHLEALLDQQKKENKKYKELLKPLSNAPRFALLSLAAQGREADVRFLLDYNKPSSTEDEFAELVNCTGYPERDYPTSPTDTPIKNALFKNQLKTAALLVSFGATITEKGFYRLIPHLDEQTIQEERFQPFINAAIKIGAPITNAVAESIQLRNVPVVTFLAQQEGFNLQQAFVDDKGKPRNLVLHDDSKWNMKSSVEDLENQDVEKIGALAKVAATHKVPQNVVEGAFASLHPEFEKSMKGKPLFSAYVNMRMDAVAKSFDEVSRSEV